MLTRERQAFTFLHEVIISDHYQLAAMNKSERGGNIFDFIEMAKQVTIKREQGVNQDVEYLDYMNKVPKSNRQKDS